MKLYKKYHEAIDCPSQGHLATAAIAAIVTWISAANLLWGALIGHIEATNAGELAVTAAVIPAALTWAAILIILNKAKY